MVAEPSHNTREGREKMCELLFESFKVPALFLARGAVLASFATARQTSLVVDMGHRATTGECPAGRVSFFRPSLVWFTCGLSQAGGHQLLTWKPFSSWVRAAGV